MINRMEQYLNKPKVPAAATDYWWVETRDRGYFVSAHAARSIERRLDREPAPRWIVFRDLMGSRHRVLSASVRTVIESTAEQRARARAFTQALREERNEDGNPWDDEGRFL